MLLDTPPTVGGQQSGQGVGEQIQFDRSGGDRVMAAHGGPLRPRRGSARSWPPDARRASRRRRVRPGGPTVSNGGGGVRQRAAAGPEPASRRAPEPPPTAKPSSPIAPRSPGSNKKRAQPPFPTCGNCRRALPSRIRRRQGSSSLTVSGARCTEIGALGRSCWCALLLSWDVAAAAASVRAGAYLPSTASPV